MPSAVLSPKAGNPATNPESDFDDPILKKLVVAIHSLDQTTFTFQVEIGQLISKLLRSREEPRVKKLICWVTRKKQQTVEKYMRWARLYLMLPNDGLWQAVGYDGVFMVSHASEPNQKKVIGLVLEHQKKLSADKKNNTTLPGACFVSTQLTRLGEVKAAKILSCSKLGKKVKQKAKALAAMDKEAKRALLDLKAVLLRVPSFSGEFEPTTLTLLKTI
jgi:hypothetical protein